MVTTTTTPRVYVASLSDYNAGILHGRWIDATLGIDHIWEEVNAMLRESPAVRRGDTFGSPAEEWAIHDYEGFGARLSEYESLEAVATAAELIAERGDAVVAYLAQRDGGLPDSDEDLEEEFNDRYVGEYESLRDYAYDCVEELGLGGIAAGASYQHAGDYSGKRIDVLEALSSYIDYDTVARELEQDHTWSGGHVFRDY